ncbi:MAG: hypothetical protein ACO1TE_19215 [Prosthecobacter sp.]
MPACQIEDYQDNEAAREELISWLVATDTHGLDGNIWRRRMAHWWDENPFSALCPERGWLLRQEGRLVGFLGLIPVCYAVHGKPTPAYMASTWRVDEPHRNASLPMFMRLRRLGAQHLVVDSTPTPDVQQLMRRCGWVACCEVRKHFLELGWAGRLLHGGCVPSLSPGLRLIRDPAEVRAVAQGGRAADGLGKWVTPESVRWFTSSPMRRHVFVGVVDAESCLTSHLVCTPTRVQGVPAWLAVDHFTARTSNAELHALVGALVGGGVLPGGRLLLSVAAFPEDSTWDGLRCLHSRPEQVCHYFLLPEGLRGLRQHTVLAEGDWGL